MVRVFFEAVTPVGYSEIEKRGARRSFKSASSRHRSVGNHQLRGQEGRLGLLERKHSCTFLDSPCSKVEKVKIELSPEGISASHCRIYLLLTLREYQSQMLVPSQMNKQEFEKGDTRK